jgi:uncharacterized protein YbjQ (UPF0145 family)
MINYLDLIIFLALLAAGFIVGQLLEKRHYASIFRREQELANLPAIASKHTPAIHNIEAMLVTGNVVVSVDYFKRFLAALRNFFGGRVKSYETLIDRARRESMLRMKEAAHAAGATIIFNIKIETASIYKGRRHAIGSVEVLTYGTALIPKQPRI